MTAHQNAGTPPDARADRAPLHRGRRRPAVRWIAHGVLFVAPVAGAVARLLLLAPLIPGVTAYLRLRLRVPTAKGKAKESPPRRRLADRILSINFCRTRCVPRSRNILPTVAGPPIQR
jgi:hypothetical protein